MRPLVAAAVPFLSCSLACAGMSDLVGYGNEIVRTEVILASPITIAYTPTLAASHSLWLDYAVGFEGGDYTLTGTLTATSGGETLGTWNLAVSHADGPLAPDGSATHSRYSLNQSFSVLDGRGHAEETVFLAAIPPVPAGQPVEVTGTITTGNGTLVQRLSLVVTD